MEIIGVAQPVEYSRQYDFEDFQSSNPTTPLPADQVEAEYNAIKLTTDQLRANLALIQRDDTRLANSSVHLDALETAVKALMQSAAWTVRGAWADLTAYAVGDLVVNDGTPYFAYIAHTSSGAIDTTKFSSLTSPVATPDDPADDNKFLRASGGVGVWVTLTAAMLSDVVAGLQSVITAANVGAARTALGITATGDAVATAASAAAARTALGATAIGGTIFTAADVAAVIAALSAAQTSAANVFTADQTIRSADAGAGIGPKITLDRNSATPADNDFLGAIEWLMRSDLPSTRTAARVHAQALDVSDTTEDVILAFETLIAGTLATRGYFGAGLVVGSPTGGDQGAGSVNAESLLVDGAPITGNSAWDEIAEGTLSGAGPFDILWTPSEWRQVRLLITSLVFAAGPNTLVYQLFDDDNSEVIDGANTYRGHKISGASNGSTVTGAAIDTTSALLATISFDDAFRSTNVVIDIFDPNQAAWNNTEFNVTGYFGTNIFGHARGGVNVRNDAGLSANAGLRLTLGGSTITARYKLLGVPE
jgi:hypothetical protein